MIYSHWLEVCVLVTDDGAVRKWKNYKCDEFYDKKELVTAFQALIGMQPLAKGVYSSKVDGVVRIWKNYNCDKKELVTTFQALNGMQPLARGKFSRNR